jgi:uncharacterized membrane protein
MDKKRKLAFTKTNYTLMVIGLFTIVLGFFIMAMDPEPHGFGFMGLTLGPVIVVAGFVIEFFAILKKNGKQEKQT